MKRKQWKVAISLTQTVALTYILNFSTYFSVSGKLEKKTRSRLLKLNNKRKKH